jgi:hypothetical protein
MRIFLYIAIGLAALSVAILAVLAFVFHDKKVALENDLRTLPARIGRARAREAEKNPSNTKPGSEGDTDQPVTDQQNETSTENEKVV